ncbi:MAG TPA: tetratricopeptide repeat protein [Vulgatibacter sp.]|nr:tetratricopeptide repeat protein [Vulgatibacter sp.]
MDPLVANLLWAALVGMAVGAVLGVLLAASGKKRGAEGGEGRAYLSSFRYVLEGDSDGAIEELGKPGAGGPDGLAAAFALGAFFRRKGDLVRAVRLHEAILATPDLPADGRRSAKFELGVDFRRLGMFSRAVELLEEVAREAPADREALRELREICEEIGDWERAAVHQARLEALGESSPSLLAHLHAGHARKRIAEQDLEGAAAAVARALATDPRSADAKVAEAELFLAREEGADAIASLDAALRSRPEALFSVFPLLEAGFAAQGSYEELESFLRRRLEEAPGDPFLRIALSRTLRRRRLVAEAAAELRKVLEAHPHLAEARLELGELLLDGATAQEMRTELRALLKGPGNPPRPFACSDCAMELTQFFFRCPRCFGWDTIARSEPSGKSGGKEGADRGIGRPGPSTAI